MSHFSDVPVLYDHVRIAFASQDILIRPHTYLLVGRFQSSVRLIPDGLVMRSKPGLDNRFLPRYDMYAVVVYLLLALYSYMNRITRGLY